MCRMFQIHLFFFVNMLYVADIICFFASTGLWPSIPPAMQNDVATMSQKVFAQNDNQIRNYCEGKFRFQPQHFFRPGN